MNTDQENPQHNKTKVDDMLMEMIEPKVHEIEEKFANGQGLTQEDINTLLLKSQYNHINHLDEKLNIVTDSVVALEGKFVGLENKFENKFVNLENKFEGKFVDLENKFEGKFVDLENKFISLENKFEGKFVNLENKFELLKSDIQTTIQKALNRNMLMIFAMMGLFLTLSKLIDRLL